MSLNGERRVTVVRMAMTTDEGQYISWNSESSGVQSVCDLFTAVGSLHRHRREIRNGIFYSCFILKYWIKTVVVIVQQTQITL